MAFDQSTRNRLQKLVSNCRSLLSDEFSIQLQQSYGIDPNNGEVASLDRLSHLSDRERHTAQQLRDTLAHYLASETEDKEHRIQAIDRIVREQAFTVLNRLAALLMMEARGLLLASVSKGQQSQAFELYKRIAGTALGDTGRAYYQFLLSLFDEFAIDLPGLFDRYSAHGRLFPCEPVLLAVLDELNHHDIQPLWAEDETIGWIYQYFNSKEERKKMRDASQAPRNSRELAVRNQFFTPRYVVEFLVDNTLGRMWFNATGGHTELRERCPYLLVKPSENPQANPRLRDPRTIRLLDPACGSMHFGLYAFDLFLQIYQEAWSWEQQNGPGSLDISTQPDVGLQPLFHTYADMAAFLRDVPRLIIEHNIYGVDIDPRAAQIASLALWLRAQRAWHEAEVKAQQRPNVGRGHVIAAIAPPAERDLREKFSANLDGKDAELFEKTLQLLKGLPELGILLEVERELPQLIQQVYVGKGNDLFAQQEQETWLNAETRLRSALMSFAQAVKSTYQGRLFASDALAALRFIDLAKSKFDVVVMNPPFGKVTKFAEAYLKDRYPDAWTDLYGSFVWRFIATDIKSDYLGCISSSLFMYTKPMRGIRKCWVDNRSLSVLVELGSGVLDGATVDTALTISTSSNNKETFFLDLTSAKDKELSIRRGRYVGVDINDFSKLYLNPFCYHVDPLKMKLWARNQTLDPTLGTVTKGNQTFDDFRFQRLRWEVKKETIGHGWYSYEEGGEYQPFLSPTPVLYKWGNDGAEARSFQIGKYGTDAQVKQSISWWFKRGITFPRVSSVGFGPRLMPTGNIFSGDSVSIFLENDESLFCVLGYLCSSWAEDLSTAFGRHRKIEVRAIANLPVPEFTEEERKRLSVLSKQAVMFMIELESLNETSPLFLSPAIGSDGNPDSNIVVDSRKSLESICDEIDGVVGRALFGKGNEPDLSVNKRSSLINRYVREKSSATLAFEWISWLVGCAFGRWDTKSLFRVVEYSPESLLASGLPVSPPGICAKEINVALFTDDQDSDFDLLTAIRKNISSVFSDADHIEMWLEQSLGVNSIRDYLNNPSGFFAEHLRLYSRSARRAPVYWPIGTVNGGFTIWISYQSLGREAIYTIVNEAVEPKIKKVDAEITVLMQRGALRSHNDERKLETLKALESELLDLHEVLISLAPHYNPNPDDGVQVSAAPLWRLFRHKPWRNLLEDTWKNLEKGDYDWAHMAMNFWPDRVRKKCITDKSLAVAHNLEHLYIEPEPKPAKTRGRKKTGGIE